MTRPNFKIAVGISGAVFFSVVLFAVWLWPDSTMAFGFWSGLALFCFVILFGSYAALTYGEAATAEWLRQQQAAVTAAQLEAQRAKAEAEAAQYRATRALAIKAMREAGRQHCVPAAVKQDAAVQEWYIHLIELAKENGTGVGFRDLEQYFTGSNVARNNDWQRWIAEPFAAKGWISKVVPRQPTTLLVSLDRILGHLYAGDLPNYPTNLPLPRMNWNGEQRTEKQAETSNNHAEQYAANAGTA